MLIIGSILILSVVAALAYGIASTVNGWIEEAASARIAASNARAASRRSARDNRIAFYARIGRNADGSLRKA